MKYEVNEDVGLTMVGFAHKWYMRHPPIRSLRGLGRGMSRFWGSLEAVVADDLVDLYDDVLWNYRFYV